MIYSMTGYGRYELEENNRKLIIEINGVNHRYLDINTRIPRQLIYLEEMIRKIIKEKITRGKVEVNISCVSTSQEDLEISVNEAYAKAYVEGFRKIGSKLNLEDNIKLADLLKMTDIVSIQNAPREVPDIEEMVQKVLSGALDTFVQMRLKEGEHLRKDILEKNVGVCELVEQIEKRSPQVPIVYKAKLENRLAQILGEATVDPSRLATEVALFADKCSIDEEITRLKSHISQLTSILQEGGVVGRKLDFLMQEMNREANTIGSKANDYEITNLVVSLKTEIEKIREQVQNIE